MSAPTRPYLVSRWLAVHFLAFALRHGLSDADALDALRRAFRHRAADVQWRLAIVDDADRVNAERHWKGSPLSRVGRRRGRIVSSDYWNATDPADGDPAARRMAETWLDGPQDMPLDEDGC